MSVSDPIETPESAPSPETASRLPRWVLPAATGIAGFILGGLVIAGVGAVVTTVGANATPTVFTDALVSCDLENSVYAVVEDDGRTLTIESKGDEDYAGLTYEEQGCVLDALDVPSSVLAHFGQTTSMDGRQTETWDGITMSWSYHPDRGADSVLTYMPQ